MFVAFLLRTMRPLPFQSPAFPTARLTTSTRRRQVTDDPRHRPPHRPPGLPAWPASGCLEFKDVVMSYRPGLDPVLRGVSFRVRVSGWLGGGCACLVWIQLGRIWGFRESWIRERYGDRGQDRVGRGRPWGPEGTETRGP